MQTAGGAYNPLAAAAYDPLSMAAALEKSRVKRFGAGKVFYKIGMYAVFHMTRYRYIYH
jgi:hypothetical protein